VRGPLLLALLQHGLRLPFVYLVYRNNIGGDAADRGVDRLCCRGDRKGGSRLVIG
jgi:hypothetical protein